jgi:hypothetical protein
MFIFFVLVFPKGLLGLGSRLRRPETDAVSDDPDASVAQAYEAALAEGKRP